MWCRTGVLTLTLLLVSGCAAGNGGGADVDAGPDATADAAVDAADACVPLTCSTAGAFCGMIDDGCGVTLDCGEPHTGYLPLGPMVRQVVGGGSAVAVGDVTGDGRPDAVMATTQDYGQPEYSHRVYVWPQRADGRLPTNPLWFPYYPVGTTDECIGTSCHTSQLAMQLVDVDNDKDLDVVIATALGVSVLHQDAGTLGALAFIPHRLEQYVEFDMQTMDVDLDGWVDLVAPYADGVEVSGFEVYRGGPGGFAAPEHHARIMWGKPFVLEDVTGDGLRDVVAQHADGLRVFAHDGIGGFAASPTFVIDTAGIEVRHMTFGDVTEDGLPDVIVTNFTHEPGQFPIRVSVATAPGTYSAFGPYAWLTLASPDLIRIAHLDAGPFPDVVVLSNGGYGLAWFLNDAVEPQTAGTPYASFYGSDALTVADISSNNCLDLLVADYNFGLSVFYGVCSDRSCDGTLDASDLTWASP